MATEVPPSATVGKADVSDTLSPHEKNVDAKSINAHKDDAPTPPIREQDSEARHDSATDSVPQNNTVTDSAVGKDDAPAGDNVEINGDNASKITESNPAPAEPSVPAVIDAGAVQTQMLQDQLPEATDPGEAETAQQAARMAGVQLPASEPTTTAMVETDAVKGPAPVVGEKRTAEEAGVDVTKNSDAIDDKKPEAEKEAADKKIKTNDGSAAAPQRKNSKPKKTAAVGRSERQTRSQGPVA